MHQTQENMDFHENTDSENDTEVIESLFTPYTDEPIAPSDYAVTEYDNEDSNWLAAKTLADREDSIYLCICCVFEPKLLKNQQDDVTNCVFGHVTRFWSSSKKDQILANSNGRNFALFYQNSLKFSIYSFWVIISLLTKNCVRVICSLRLRLRLHRLPCRRNHELGFSDNDSTTLLVVFGTAPCLPILCRFSHPPVPHFRQQTVSFTYLTRNTSTRGKP